MELTVHQHSVYVYTGGRSLVAPATQPAVLFIHGAQQDHSCWTLQSRWFAFHGYPTLVPDLPGHGRSGGAPLASVEALADWSIALLDGLGLEQAVLIGHSLGALIALDAAARHGHRVARLVLIAPSLPMPVAASLLAAASDDTPRAAAMINAWSYSPHGQMGGHAMPGLWMLGMNQRLMERQPAGAFAVDLTACNTYQRPLASLAAVDVPTLVLAGARDRMTSPQAALAIAQALPQGRLQTLPGGHALMVEQPNAVLDALRGFIGG